MPTKLTDLQLVLLSSAAARVDGSLLPPPDSVGTQLARIIKAIPPLIKRSLVEEREIALPGQAWRADAEQHIGVVITEAGRLAIGVEPSTVVPEPSSATTNQPDAAPRSTKTAAVLALLRREEGATLAELVEATGWLPHTTRAALTGLRKKGHAITKAKRGEVTCYRLAVVAA